MRSLEEWNEDDLFQLVKDQVQEGLTLDYKRSDSLARNNACMTELSKDVSAFANSAGGRIIYGIMEEGNIPAGLDNGSDPNVISREWIEQVISSRIRPRISGIKIKPIPLAAGGTAYVIDIPQATAFAPHQADNHRYYRRFNFQSVAMEDYEIKDAMRRSTAGIPYLRFDWSTLPLEEDQPTKAKLRIYAGNLANEPIMFALIKVAIDLRLIPSEINFSDWEVRRDVVAHFDNQNWPSVLLTRNVMPTQHMPFFKETEWLLLDIIVPIPPRDSYLISYEFLAPGADKKLGGLFVIDEGEISTEFDYLSGMINRALLPAG